MQPLFEAHRAQWPQSRQAFANRGLSAWRLRQRAQITHKTGAVPRRIIVLIDGWVRAQHGARLSLAQAWREVKCG
jgi:hypothetical protein